MLNFMFLSFFLSMLLYFSAPSSFTAVWAAVLFCFFPLVASPKVLSALLLAPLRYFHPIRTCESCLALMPNASHASLVVPLLKYFCHIFNQTAAAKMQVGHFLGDLTIPGASFIGSTMLSIFVVLSQQMSVPWGPSSGSSTGPEHLLAQVAILPPSELCQKFLCQQSCPVMKCLHMPYSCGCMPSSDDWRWKWSMHAPPLFSFSQGAVAGTPNQWTLLWQAPGLPWLQGSNVA